MNVVLTGSTGLIGSALSRLLQQRQCNVRRLVRHPPLAPDEICWDPDHSVLDPSAISGADAVIHLAGENVGSSRWTNTMKRRIRESRVRGTQLLAQTIANITPPPAVFCSASAAGFYGSRGDDSLTEESSPGTGFLASVCQEWEDATLPADRAGVRVCQLRFAMVLASQGGALAKILPAYRAGLGGPIGSGRQFWSWIALPDVLDAIWFVLQSSFLRGPVNVSAPQSLRQSEFSKTLATELHRPAFLPFPAVMAHFLLGEMADELLLASARLQPEVLLRSGFVFQFPQLLSALHHLLHPPKKTN